MKRRVNGAGSIVLLSGDNRTKKYQVRLPYSEWTISKSGKAYKKQKSLGVYATWDEAEAELAKWKSKQYIDIPDKVTVSDMWELYSEAVLSTRSISNQRANKQAYQQIAKLHDRLIDKLPFLEMQQIIRSLPTHNAQVVTRALLCALEEYSKVLGLHPIGCAHMLEITAEKGIKTKSVFTPEEIVVLWKNRPTTNIPLILLYTGMRISELCLLKVDNVHWDERYCIGGTKTDAGKNRVIPLRKEIIPVMLEQLDMYKTFVNYKNSTTAVVIVGNILRELGMNHSSHECRHTFTSLAAMSGIEIPIIDKIVGHASNNVSLDVYTHYTNNILIDAVDSIKFL